MQSNTVKVHPLVAAAIVTAILGLQTWTLLAVVSLKERVAVVETKVNRLGD